MTQSTRRGQRLTRWLARYWLELVLLGGLVVVLGWFGSVVRGFIPEPQPTPAPPVGGGEFSGAMALRFVADQMEIGPRSTGTEGGLKTGDYIMERLREFGWAVEAQPFTYRGVSGRNIIAKAGSGPLLIVGAHYDTRKRADRDPDPVRRLEPVPGANDGASGVAVLLELARVLDVAKLRNEVWLVFFDAEDNGGLDGWEYSAGAEHLAANLDATSAQIVVVDMIGDSDQQIYKESNSTPELTDAIWELAAKLGYGDRFIPEYKWSITDDHTPFLRRGYPAVDLIDFDYPFYHTSEDTLDKVSAEALERVGRVLQAFLIDGVVTNMPANPQNTEEISE